MLRADGRVCASPEGETDGAASNAENERENANGNDSGSGSGSDNDKAELQPLLFRSAGYTITELAAIPRASAGSSSTAARPTTRRRYLIHHPSLVIARTRPPPRHTQSAEGITVAASDDRAASERLRRKNFFLLRRASSLAIAPVILEKAAEGGDVRSAEDVPPPAGAWDESRWRWAVLLCSCLLLFGNYYDLPAALNISMQAHLGVPYDEYQYIINLLYSVYSLPNIFLPFLGGQLIDRYDVRKVLLVFCACVCVGQTVFAAGVHEKSIALMVLGRGIFGIGGECVSVVQSSITTMWFRQKELAFALGLNLCISRLGSATNSVFSPRISQLTSVPFAVWVGSGMCYLSLAAALVLAGIITFHPLIELSLDVSRVPPAPAELTAEPANESAETEPLLSREQANDKKNETANSNSDINNRPCPIRHQTTAVEKIRAFPVAYWLLCAVCILLYGTVIPFNNILQDFLQDKWFAGDLARAGAAMAIPDVMSALLVPLTGALVDRVADPSLVLACCGAVFAAVHLTLGLVPAGFVYVPPELPLAVLGLAYSFYGSTIWPAVALVVVAAEKRGEERLLGAAYGLATSVLNLALTVFPVLTGVVRSAGGSWVAVEAVFAAMSAAGCAVAVLLWRGPWRIPRE